MSRVQFFFFLFPAFLGCSEDESRCAAPPPPEAAFRLQLTPDRGPLPPGTVLTIAYGGDQTESYTVGKANVGNVDVCCRPGTPTLEGLLPGVPCASPDAGSPDAGSGGPVTALLCELWTNGTAAVTVVAPGYPELDVVLDAKLRPDRCGVATQDERLILFHAEGGI